MNTSIALTIAACIPRFSKILMIGSNILSEDSNTGVKGDEQILEEIKECNEKFGSLPDELLESIEKKYGY